MYTELFLVEFQGVYNARMRPRDRSRKGGGGKWERGSIKSECSNRWDRVTTGAPIMVAEMTVKTTDDEA
jgi:hypothetical protein